MGEFAGLNLADYVGDSPATLMRNWVIAAEAIGFAEGDIARARQVHGDEIVELDRGGQHELQADAVISRTPGLAVGVFTADCVPVLAVTPERSSVAAIHCGWKGVTLGLAARALRQLVGADGVFAEVRVFVGACISGGAYEVGPEVAERFAESGSGGRHRWRGRGDRYQLDLRAVVASQLLDAGVRAEHLDVSDACTFAESERYFSYRRDGAATGRMLSVVGLRTR